MKASELLAQIRELMKLAGDADVVFVNDKHQHDVVCVEIKPDQTNTKKQVIEIW